MRDRPHPRRVEFEGTVRLSAVGEFFQTLLKAFFEIRQVDIIPHKRFISLLKTRDFFEAPPGLLPPDAASQTRSTLIVDRIKAMAADLASRNIRLSPSEITYLGRKFIMYLAEAHRRTTPRIRKAMQMAGGYILHLDAMHEGDSPALMTGIP
jgi:hypothetical protein